MELDDKDRTIIDLLLGDSRLSYRQISKKAGMSVATVMHHVNKLHKEGIIKGYTTILDYEKLGFDVQVIIEMRVSKGKLFEVEKKIAKHPSVTHVYDVTGEFDAVIVAKFQNRRKMDSFLKQIQTYDFVERTLTKLILNTIKDAPLGI